MQKLQKVYAQNNKLKSTKGFLTLRNLEYLSLQNNVL